MEPKRRQTEQAEGGSSTAEADTEQEYESTIFDGLNIDCMNELLDWLPLNSLCAFSQTCKRIQQTVKNYFRWKYPSEEFDVGDEFVFDEQHLKCFGNDVQKLLLFDSSIADYKFAASNINRNLREIQFDRTFKQENRITKEHIHSIRPILENVKTVSIVNSSFTEGSPEYLLECCKKIENFSFEVGKDPRKNRFQFQKYPTIRNIEMHFHVKANVTEAITALKEQNLQLDELVLLFCKEHANAMETVFNILDAMYEQKCYKHLFVMFEKKSMVSDNINRIASLQGLAGLACSYTINASLDNHLNDIARLQNIKYLNINWLLENCDQFAKDLQQLIELETSVISMDAIVSFVRYSVMLSRFHIDQIRANKENNSKFDAFTLNKRRSMLEYARKLTIYVPEKRFIKLKWSSVTMNSDLVEIKREESCIPLNSFLPRYQEDL